MHMWRRLHASDRCGGFENVALKVLRHRQLVEGVVHFAVRGVRRAAAEERGARGLRGLRTAVGECEVTKEPLEAFRQGCNPTPASSCGLGRARTACRGTARSRAGDATKVSVRRRPFLATKSMATVLI
jgi:hypothetical protein